MRTVVNDTNNTGAAKNLNAASASAISTISANAISATKTVKPGEDISATKAMRAGEDINATKTVKPGEDISATKAMRAGEDINATKTVKPGEDISATKAMKPGENISATKAMRAGENTGATKAMKKPDKTIENESKKKQAYHLIMRGYDRKKVFGDDKDYKKFLSLLNNLMQRFDAVLYAFTLMTNHIHLLVKIADIELFTEYLTKAYTGYFYYRYKKPGRLFEPSLFYPKNSVYLKMNIIIYILNNPALANMSTQPWTYKYNSYLFYTTAYNELTKYVKVEPSIIRKNFSSLDSFKDLLRSKMVVERAEKRFKYMEDEW